MRFRFPQLYVQFFELGAFTQWVESRIQPDGAVKQAIDTASAKSTGNHESRPGGKPLNLGLIYSIRALLGRAIERGSLRKDFDATLGALSLMSMLLFPFIAQPVVEQVFGVRMTDAFVERLIQHTARLYYEGARAERVLP